MFRIKGQVQTSHLSNLQAYRPKYHFQDNVIPILSFYRIQNQIGSHIRFRIKGQVQTSHLSNLQAYRPKYHFRDKVIPIISFYRIQNQILSVQGHSNTSILPNKKLNRLTYHVSHPGTSSNITFIKLVGIQSKISFLRQGSIKYFYFTEYKTKQVYISCLQQGTSRDKFKLPIYQTSPQGSVQYFNFTKFKTKQVQISCFKSWDKFNLHIYQNCNNIGQNLVFATRFISILSFYRI